MIDNWKRKDEDTNQFLLTRPFLDEVDDRAVGVECKGNICVQGNNIGNEEDLILI